MPTSPLAVFLLVLTGLAVGFVAGLFGVGGGFLLTPILLYAFHVPVSVAVGSSLCQQVGTSLSAFLRYRHLKRGEPRVDWVMMGGGLLGVDAGGRVLAWVSRLDPVELPGGRTIGLASLLLSGLFAVLLFSVAAFVGSEASRAARAGDDADRVPAGALTRWVRVPPFVALPNAGLPAVSVPLLSGIGFLLGFLSGVMGVGGGVLLLPVLIYGVGMSARVAAGTGVLLLFVTVLWGTAGAAWRGDVSLPLALTLLAGSSIGAQWGASVSNRLPNRTLRRVFAILVLAAGGAVLANLLREWFG